MIKIVKTELMKLQRYSVVWIGVAAMLSVVLLTRFMATASDGTVHTLENFSNNVIWNNYSIMFPAAITLIAGYVVDRERTDDTLKNILTVPVSFQKLLVGKLLAVGLLSVLLALVEYALTMAVFFMSRYPGFSVLGMLRVMMQMTGMNVCVYIAVLPIIAVTAQRSGSFMPGVGFAFFYGFIGTFASGHGLGEIYPITAGLGLIGYQNGSTGEEYHVVLSVGVLFLMLLVTVFLVLTSRNREPAVKKSAYNKKHKGD